MDRTRVRAGATTHGLAVAVVTPTLELTLNGDCARVQVARVDRAVGCRHDVNRTAVAPAIVDVAGPDEPGQTIGDVIELSGLVETPSVQSSAGADDVRKCGAYGAADGSDAWDG